MGQEAEVLADDARDGPSEQRLGCVRHEREDPVGVGAPDHVRRRLDQTAEARLLAGQPDEQVRVGKCDRGLIGQTLQQVEIGGREGPRR